MINYKGISLNKIDPKIKRERKWDYFIRGRNWFAKLKKLTIIENQF